MRIDTGPSGQLRRRVGCSPTSHGGLSEDPQRREFLPVGVLALLPVPGSGRNAKIIFEPEGRSGVSYQTGAAVRLEGRLHKHDPIKCDPSAQRANFGRN